ncbi:MAG: hypothetical protein ACM3JJ_00665 [Hyphomicrobiales bacterium]
MIRRAMFAVALVGAAALCGCSSSTNLPTGPGIAPQNEFPLFETTDLVDTTTAFQFRLHRRFHDPAAARALRSAELASGIPPGTRPDDVEAWAYPPSGGLPAPRAVTPPAVAFYEEATKSFQAGDFSVAGQPILWSYFVYEASSALRTSYDVDGIQFQTVYVVTITLSMQVAIAPSYGRGFGRTLTAVYTPDGVRRYLSDRGGRYIWIS